MEKDIHLYIPRWATILYAALAIILIPWILVLAEYLPARHLDRHWDAIWVGFDVIILITLAITTYFMIKQTIWVIVSATALATLFIVDVWFDVLTSRPGRQEDEAIFSGIIELSLALLTYRLVYQIVRRSIHGKNLKVIISQQQDQPKSD